eukprot:m51a1_g11856 putative 26s proteasome non-atpase regulatory subunit 7 (526) ;mRNA; r:497674-499955
MSADDGAVANAEEVCDGCGRPGHPRRRCTRAMRAALCAMPPTYRVPGAADRAPGHKAPLHARTRFVPPLSPLGLLEEATFSDPWKLLVCCKLLNRTSARQVRKILQDLFERWPGPQELASADTADVSLLIKPLGMSRRRASALQRFSLEFLEWKWETAKELHGVGKYGDDAYRMFCCGLWKPTDTAPTDRELLAYQQVPFSRVIVHPLVLLSAVDHSNRIPRAPDRRVVGVLLGQYRHGAVDVLSSFAVPFEEEGKVWFLDHNYLENMAHMCRKVNARETIVGWYSTGPKIRACDIEVNELIRKYTPHPVLLVTDMQLQDNLSLPFEAYVSVGEVIEEAGPDGVKKPVTAMSFRHLASEVGTLTAEEVGVEHLLRDIAQTSTGSVNLRIRDKAAALQSLRAKITEMKRYVEDVAAGRLPPNQRVLEKIQDVFNLMPGAAAVRGEAGKALVVKSNDMLSAVYLGSVVRSVIALHDLINNKIEYREAERKLDEKANAAQAPPPAPVTPSTTPAPAPAPAGDKPSSSS